MSKVGQAVRPTALRGPCDDERPEWPGPHGSASAAGNHGSSRVGGCSAGRCACSRLSLHCQELLELQNGDRVKTASTKVDAWNATTWNRGSTKQPGPPDALQGTDSPTWGSNSPLGSAPDTPGQRPCQPCGLVGRTGKLLASRAHGSESPSPPERLFRAASLLCGCCRQPKLPTPVDNCCGQRAGAA